MRFGADDRANGVLGSAHPAMARHHCSGRAETGARGPFAPAPAAITRSGNTRHAGARLAASGLAAVMLLTAGEPVHAQSMPDSLTMSCAATAALVRQRGAVVIGTGPGIFDRYVSTQGYCAPGETTAPVWLQTADQKQCFIGYRCRDRLPRLR